MRLLLLLLLGMASGLAAETQVQQYIGPGAQTTPAFQVQDKWELRWECPDVTAITLLGSDGVVVAGVAASAKGSVYLPKGGSFSLKISPSANVTGEAWHVTVVQLDPASTDSSIATNYVPETVAAQTNVVTAPAPPASTADFVHAVVLVKGDLGEGTGFLVKTPDGPAVITNLHVLSANPNIKITTATGQQIKTLGLKGATDRDIAMVLIQDDHYTYLDYANDVAGTVQDGDEVITPGNSEGGGVMLNTKGTVLALGPQTIEITNPFYHGNSGGPVLHTKSGKVVGVVVGAVEVKPTDALDRASLANKDSAITAKMRYFGLRLDTVPAWETYDWNRFLGETNFLKDFHDLTRCLDSYLNGARYEKARVASNEENGYPTSQYYLRNPKIVKSQQGYHHMASDADASQNLDAARELIMDLQGIGATDMTAIQNPNNFYSFDRMRIDREIKYRKAMLKEIEGIGDKVSDLGH